MIRVIKSQNMCSKQSPPNIMLGDGNNKNKFILLNDILEVLAGFGRKFNYLGVFKPQNSKFWSKFGQAIHETRYTAVYLVSCASMTSQEVLMTQGDQARSRM